MGVAVVLVTFSSVGYGRVWLKEVCEAFTLLIDRERETYALYGLKRSLRSSWNLRTIWAYIRLMLKGRKWKGIKGDSAQLGGDFVIDAQGIVRLAHPSKDPTDRPKVDDLVRTLAQLTDGSR
jgi:peroxiredoxin